VGNILGLRQKVKIYGEVTGIIFDVLQIIYNGTISDFIFWKIALFGQSYGFFLNYFLYDQHKYITQLYTLK